MKYLIAHTDPDIHPVDDFMRQSFASIDAEVFADQCNTETEIINFAENADSILTARSPLTEAVIKKLRRCKVIGRFGAGTDNVDLKAATKYGIVVVYVPDFCTEEVSNHALMFILACCKKVFQLDKSVRSGKWGCGLSKDINDLKGQVLGLVGFGRIAQSLAKKAQVFGMRVIACDPYIQETVFHENTTEQVTLEELLQESDYVSLHVPLTSDTKGRIGYSQLRQMKPTAYLINCARGQVIDEAALVEILSQNMIAGAALDCLAMEPPSKSNPLFKMENVILTPHSAAISKRATRYVREKTITQVVDVLKGRKPEFVRNPDVFNERKIIEYNTPDKSILNSKIGHLH